MDRPPPDAEELAERAVWDATLADGLDDEPRADEGRAIVDRAAEIIKRGDPGEILRIAFGARLAAEEGRYCECEEPTLYGYDFMCGTCLLENQGQISRKERAMREPHAFVPDRRASAARRLGMCEFCSGWEDDPRHATGATRS